MLNKKERHADENQIFRLESMLLFTDFSKYDHIGCVKYIDYKLLESTYLKIIKKV